MRNAIRCMFEYSIFNKALKGELMELRINHEDNVDIQSVITVVVNNEVVLNKLLIEVRKIEIDAPECTIFIKEGYTDIGELIGFIFAFFLSSGGAHSKGLGILDFLYINVAHVTARADTVNLEYAAQNTGSIFTSPDMSANIKYQHISTRHRIRMWELFVLTPIILVMLSIALAFGVTSHSFASGALITVLVFLGESLILLPLLNALYEAKKAIK